MSVLGNRIVWGNPRERDLAPSLLPRFFQTIYTLSSVLLSTSSISPDPSSHPPPAVVMGLPSRLEGPCHVRPELRPCSAGKWGGGTSPQSLSSFSCLPLLFLVPGGLVGDLRPLDKCELPCKLVEKAGSWSCEREGFPRNSSAVWG